MNKSLLCIYIYISDVDIKLKDDFQRFYFDVKV